MPHLNYRGVVESASGDSYTIVLSEFFKNYFLTDSIVIYAPNSTIKLKEKDDVFIKFLNINIHENKLYFTALEIYKYTEKIEKKGNKKVAWWSINDFGGFLKTTGTEFVYNGFKYVDPDNELSEDGKKYFVDIYDEQLLIEEYKNVFPPMKWYNMVNPQETYFDIIVDIYKKM